MFYPQLSLLVTVFSVFSAVAFPSQLAYVHRRASPNNIVKLESAEKYCMIMPLDPHADIGASEYPGGTMTYCSEAARFDDSQGTIPGGFWKSADFQTGYGSSGARFARLTGCIDPGVVDRLNSGDLGGQYDSSGGKEGRGNPRDSACQGYNHYVELVEPKDGRACLKCCDDPNDCSLKRDTFGCPAAISGNYFDCA